MSNPSPGFPLHRMNTAVTSLWRSNFTFRRTLASKLVQMLYRGGFGVCSNDLRLIAVVDPNGIIRELKPPHTIYEMWQMANAPAAQTECACRDYFDPEVQGPHRQRGPDAGHHPFCQFKRTSAVVFKEAQGRAAERVGIPIEHGIPMYDPSVKTNKLNPQSRPDEWQRIEKEVT